MHSTLFLHAGFQLAVIVLLAVVPFISATPNPSQPPRRGVEFRDPVVQKRYELPKGWSLVGCYTDDFERPTLTSSTFTSDLMYVGNCVKGCDGRNNIYAGLENGKYCHCGNVLTVGATSASPSDCNSTCIFDSGEICGGTNRLSLYSSWTGATPPPQPTFTQNVGLWTLMGCYNDSSDARTLPEQPPGNSTQLSQYGSSVEGCTSACGLSGYRLAGVGYRLAGVLDSAQNCWCDNDIKNGGQKIDTKYCPLACSENSSEICGGANSLVMYRKLVRDENGS